MLARWLISVLLMWSTASMAQVSGRFYLEKETFQAGEPVFLYFEVTNQGSAENILRADPYSFCSGYQIKISSDPRPGSSCVSGVGGSCLSSSMSLPAGKSYTERILLNYEHNVGLPGDYDVEAVRNLPHGSGDVFPLISSQETLEVHAQLHFRVERSGRAAPKILQAWVGQLQSKDPSLRSEAARTLASLAPQSLESVLLRFADDPDLKTWAPLALHRLNTPRSMAALAELLTKTKPGTYENMQSADFLAESGDPQWFPLLSQLAREKGQINTYVEDAAESGGDKALPLLFELLRSPDKEFTQLNAVYALGATGSRDAVPVLLDLLRKQDTDIASRALSALQRLTHRQYGAARWTDEPQAQHAAWLQWWMREGSTAHIYKPNECGDFTPLK